MVRFVRLLAAAALAAGLAAPAAHAQTSGPLEPAAPVRAAKPHETTLKKRAKRRLTRGGTSRCTPGIHHPT